jgi:outer membrane protein OmpA-like peptidoglycan-associated protein
MKTRTWLIAFLVALSLPACAQNLEFNGGYAHISGDGGLDGFNVGAAWWLARRVSLAFDYDSAWDTSHLGVFELTQTGVIVTKSHLQDFLVGPRVFFPRGFKTKQKYVARLFPLGEAQFGVSHLSSRLQDPTAKVSQSASDNAFTWMLGGGADYRFDPHWAGRFKVDFLRTHFADTGQSRVRFTMGIMYSFGRMLEPAKTKAQEAEAAAAARRTAAAEQVESEKLAAADAAEAKRKAELDLAAAEARKRVAMEQLAAQEAAAAPKSQPESAEAPKPEVEAAAATARQEAMAEAEREKETLRAHLLERFNHILPTTDTPRGLVVNMGDVLFETGKSDLRPEAREDLAKLSGIVLNYPLLRLTIEGHTDNSGNAELNQTLSEQRAKTVRDYLVNQGLSANSLTARGLGENNPVADNSTDEGRQKNRRVEIIVSGEAIGTKIGK